jgi:hypothetical protein
MAAAPTVDEAFQAALEHDAAVTPPAYDPPPRQQASADPEAPHGRDDDGKPLAPHGVNKKTGRPNLKPAGPGRGHKGDDEARVKPPGKEIAGKTGGKTKADYSEDLAGLAMGVWMGASAVKGGRIPLIKVKLPDLRPYAYVWHEQLPQGVAVWNNAAQQNATVRRYVEKLAGEGSWQWVIGVGIWSANLLAGCQELAGDAETRKTAAAANDLNMKEFLETQMAMATEAAA